VDKLGSYITNLMLIIQDKEQNNVVRDLALEKLKKLSTDMSEFIFNWIDEIETLDSNFPKDYDEDKANKRMEIIGQNGPTGEHYNKNQTELEL
tara:strand:- start:70 stop:348 length:279 start_codon:yes stop_codon:yes gene_type:complete